MEPSSTTSTSPSVVTRRTFLRVFGGASLALTGLSLAASVASAAPPARPTLQSGTVKILSAGGALDDCLRSAVWTPYAQESGLSIVDIGGSEPAKIKAAVEAKNVEWDIVESWTEVISAGIPAGWFVEVPWQQLSNGADVFPDLRGTLFAPFGVPIFLFSSVVGYNTNAFPNPATAPQSWADFWNVDQFPGSRALYAYPEHQLEIALMADGVPIDQIYPIDIDRAFQSLDRIKPYIKTFYETGAQQVQLVSSGEVAMSSVWNGRMFAAQNDGQPVNYTFNQGILSVDHYSVLSGGPNTPGAWKVVNAMIDPKKQAALAACIGYGPTNAKAFDGMDPALAAKLPSAPANKPIQAVQNLVLWSQMSQPITERYNAWKIS